MLERLRSLAFPAALIGLLLWVALGRSGLGSGNLAPGTRIEAVTVVELGSGRITDLAALAASGPVALHVFGTWCGACMREWPSLKGLAARYGDRVRLVPIGIDSPTALMKLVRSQPVGVPVFVGDEEIERALRVPVYPYTVFLDRELQVFHDYAGVVGDRVFRAAIERLQAPSEVTAQGRAQGR